MAVTIKDVAKLAGVSPSTVSRTCKNHPSISQQTKERVKKAMEELGYMQNNLHTVANIRNIGVVFPKLKNDAYENPFYLEALRGIGQYCNRKKYTMLVITGENDAELIESIKSSQADGFIFLYSNVDDTIINYMYEEQRLFVLIGKATKMINDTIYVDNDNVQAAKEATEYLISLGHKKIAYIGTDSHRVFSSDRKAGYLLALSEHNLPYQEKYCLELSAEVEPEYENLKKLLTSAEKPTAILVCDDVLAVSIEKTIRQCCLSVPQDLSLISFNNSIFARMMNLTSIDINSYQLGIEAAAQLSKHIENPALFATKIIVPYFLVERESCAKRIDY